MNKKENTQSILDNIEINKELEKTKKLEVTSSYEIPKILKIIEEQTVDNKKKKKVTIKDVKENLGMLLYKIVFLAVFIIVLSSMYGIHRNKGMGMLSSIKDGDLMFTYKVNKTYYNQDVIYFKYNKKRYTSRVVAIEGQRVEFDKNGTLIVDGIPENTLYSYGELDKKELEKYPVIVGKNKVFVVNDYRLDSNDSRTFGEIDISTIEGKVISFLRTRDI